MKKIETHIALRDIVELDTENTDIKNIATLFLNAMNDWPTENQMLISDFTDELKSYFGTPLTIEQINKKKFTGENSWELEAGSSIADLLSVSINVYNEPNLDIIVAKILNHYNGDAKY